MQGSLKNRFACSKVGFCLHLCCCRCFFWSLIFSALQYLNALQYLKSSGVHQSMHCNTLQYLPHNALQYWKSTGLHQSPKWVDVRLNCSEGGEWVNPDDRPSLILSSANYHQLFVPLLFNCTIFSEMIWNVMGLIKPNHYISQIRPNVQINGALFSSTYISYFELNTKVVSM